MSSFSLHIFLLASATFYLIYHYQQKQHHGVPVIFGLIVVGLIFCVIIIFNIIIIISAIVCNLTWCCCYWYCCHWYWFVCRSCSSCLCRIFYIFLCSILREFDFHCTRFIWLLKWHRNGERSRGKTRGKAGRAASLLPPRGKMESDRRIRTPFVPASLSLLIPPVLPYLFALNIA